MMLNVGRDELFGLLGGASRTAGARSGIEILGAVKLYSKGGVLKVTSTDLDMVFQGEIKAEGDIDCAVSAKLFYDTVKVRPEGGEIGLKQDGNQLAIFSGRSKTLLPIIAQELPEFTPADYDTSFKIPCADLLILLKKPLYAVADPDHYRDYLKGIYLTPDSGFLVAVATDGYVMKSVSVSLPGGADRSPGVILPTSLCIEAARLCAGCDIAEFSVSPSRVKIQTKAGVLVSKLIDGQYPDYKRMTPSGDHISVPIDVAQLSDAVRRVSVIYKDRSRRTELTLADGALSLKFKADGSEAEDCVIVDCDGKDEIALDFKLLLNTLSQLSGQVTMEFRGYNAGCVFREKESPDDLALVMPLRF